MPRSCDVGARVIAILTEARAVEADETDIDAVVSVLVMSLSTAPRCFHAMVGSCIPDCQSIVYTPHDELTG